MVNVFWRTFEQLYEEQEEEQQTNEEQLEENEPIKLAREKKLRETFESVYEAALDCDIV
jgi:hypothetical protein